MFADDIDIDEPVVVVSTSQKSSNDIKGRSDKFISTDNGGFKHQLNDYFLCFSEKGRERERLFDGGSSDNHPKARTREEIIAKYRNTGVRLSLNRLCF